MAELASTISANILEKLGYLVYSEFMYLAFDIKDELRKLQSTIYIIKGVLLDAEEKQASDRALSRWLRQLKDVFYDAEDVLCEVEYEALRKEAVRRSARSELTSEEVYDFFPCCCTPVRRYGRISRELHDLFPCCSALAFRRQLGHKIKNIRKTLGEIAADKDQFNLTARLEVRHVMPGRRDMTHSFVSPSNVIGRNDDKKIIIDLLMGPNAQRNVNVIPIVGLGGLGKTTVSKLVYDDERVTDHFDLRMWVCVSEDFDVPRLIREILKESGCRIDERLSTLNELQTKLREMLKNKKFLLVLDDVWNEDCSKWSELIELLSGGLEGSRIVVTTRSCKVAIIVGTGSPYILGGLSDDDCLSLFVKWAFKEGEDKQYPNLLEIGKEIVRKCKGVPLAIRSLGSLLFSNVNEHEWKFVRDNEIWKLEQRESDILPALKISYDKIPNHLKQCFALCSLFPKDYVFRSDELIALWMAHGLLSRTHNNFAIGELEYVGHMYIQDLLSRSFFQDVHNSFWDFRYWFKMHDLFHDLARKVAQDDCSIVDCQSTQTDVGSVRHLSFSHNGQVPQYFDMLSSGVRTTLFPTEQQEPALVQACISRFKYLRVLSLSNSSFEVLPNSIGTTLKHLKYLDLSGNDRIEKLPDSICKLYNLQTLLLHECRSLALLPKDIRDMKKLAYLTVTTTSTRLFEGNAMIFPALRVLRIYYCSRLEVLFERDNHDGIRALGKLRTLVIAYCKKLTSLGRYRQRLLSLENLVILNCDVLSLTGEGCFYYFPMLKNLKICDLPKLEVFPSWLPDTLQFLSIENCGNFRALPRWLPILKSLHTLEILNCSKLSSLPEGMDRLTALKELKIVSCPELIRKCREEDCSKIAHIPTRLLIDDEP